MAKTRRYRRYSRRNRGRWSSNIRLINETPTAGAPPGTFFLDITLATNPSPLPTTITQINTVKNVEFTYKTEIPELQGSNLIEQLTGYIMYRPEGVVVTETLPITHPEWIMAYQYLGSPDVDNTNQYAPKRIKTRLSRRLNSGDSIIFLLTGRNDANQNIPININGLVRWWTKAN